MREIMINWTNRLKFAAGIITLLSVVIFYVVRSERHEQQCAEAAELLKEFQIISDPFTRPKLYRHRDAKNLNPSAKLPDDEVLFLATSDGTVVFVTTVAHGSVKAGPNGMLSKPLPVTGTLISFSMNDARIKLLANDVIFEAMLDPCYAKAGSSDRYSWIPGWAQRDKDVVSSIAKTVLSDSQARPYIYRLNRGDIEGTIEGKELAALKQTFQLAKLIRETGN